MMITSDIVLELAITILISGSLFALSAVGFTLAYRVTKILHLAHGAVVLASGYAFWWGMARGGSLALSSAFALAVAVGMVWVMHLFVYEHLRHRGKVATTMSLVATLALLVLVQNMLLAFFGSGTKSIPLSNNSETIVFSGTSITTVQMLVVGVSLFAVIATMLFLRRTRLGKSMRAVADNEIAAQVVGIDVRRVRLAAFLLVALLAGIAGILYALEFDLNPSMGTEIAIRSFSRALIGGAGSIPGALLGSFVIEGAEDVGAFFFTAGMKNVFSFAIVFLFLLFRPRGIFGERVRREDL
ncbi:branched-chain amino acid ABC transporter permease [Candidatus Uhrbacteria bacterium]|nr:branched-chain amino acid ABC transporter permease [Candidatus Uhrbacteria bacterium]